MKQNKTPYGGIPNNAKTIATLNPDEFHPDTMIAGSTGIYRDMDGGSHFRSYPCGDRYNDSITGIHTTEPDYATLLRSELKDPRTIRNAILLGDVIMQRKRPRRRRK